eukprot:XP_016882293.1 adenylate kinase isoenzyme 1-like isoform X1 [Homo sapiens]
MPPYSKSMPRDFVQCHSGTPVPLQALTHLPHSSWAPQTFSSPPWMGGPGCGKGTQCKNMATKYGFCHVGLDQLLRQEAQRSTQRGRQIRDITLQGLLVPAGIIPDMVSDNMLSRPESRGFLIDGFPQEVKQAMEFERIVSGPEVWVWVCACLCACVEV